MKSAFNDLSNCTINACKPFYVSYRLSRQFLKFSLNRYIKYADVPFDVLKKFVIAAYEGCNGTLAQPPNYPNVTERNLLTQEFHWLPRYIDNGYQLDMWANPLKENVSIDGYLSFTHCVFNNITEEVKKFTSANITSGLLMYLGLVIATFLLMALFLYCMSSERCEDNSNNYYSTCYVSDSCFFARGSQQDSANETTTLFTGNKSTFFIDHSSTSDNSDSNDSNSNDSNDESFSLSSNDDDLSKLTVSEKGSINHNEDGVNENENSLNLL